MSVETNGETNKAIVRDWMAARNTHDVESAVALWTEEQQAGLRSSFNGFTTAFPDVQITIQEIIGEGDKVAILWTFLGTHRGTFQGIPATGKTVEWDGLDLYTLTEGKLSALRIKADSRSLLQQLGVA